MMPIGALENLPPAMPAETAADCKVKAWVARADVVVVRNARNFLDNIAAIASGKAVAYRVEE